MTEQALRCFYLLYTWVRRVCRVRRVCLHCSQSPLRFLHWNWSCRNCGPCARRSTWFQSCGWRGSETQPMLEDHCEQNSEFHFCSGLFTLVYFWPFAGSLRLLPVHVRLPHIANFDVPHSVQWPFWRRAIAHGTSSRLQRQIIRLLEDLI